MAVAKNLECLGFTIDGARNDDTESKGAVRDISRDGSRHRVLVCQTDEQMEMARTCAEEEKFW